MNHPYIGTAYEPYVILLSHNKKNDAGEWKIIITPYMQVDGRVKEASDEAKGKPALSYASQIVKDDDQVLVMHATVTTARGTASGTSAIYKRTMKGVDAENPYEVCETSAVGRALAFLGYGIIPHSGLTSAEDAVRTSTERAAPNLDSVNYWRSERTALIKDAAIKIKWFRSVNAIADTLARWELGGHIQRDMDDAALFAMLNKYANQQADKKAR